MLNNIINIDLHIHSKASAYKEEKGFVDKETKENLPILFQALNERNINLFSITDHNRFDAELYKECTRIINDESNYSNVKGIVAGVEFDVLLEEGNNPCHIITIFDAKNNNDFDKIEEIINHNLLESKNSYYKRDDFEKILKKIGLNTLLIVHQKTSLDRKDKSQKSLSGSVNDPYIAIEIGYIHSLEYQKSGVEGILKDNLKKVDRNISLITGSDCHQWSYYPKHDKDSLYSMEKFTSMKCLPTFKGLLFSMTSPQTRINLIDKESKDSFINSFKLGDSVVELDKGINAIVGENGSGKSTLLKLLTGNNRETYVKSIAKKSKFELLGTLKKDHIWTVEQSEIVDKFREKKLFDSSYFNPINHMEFETLYTNYAKSLKGLIEDNIRKKEALDKIADLEFKIDIDKEKPTYYIQIDQNNLNVENTDIISERITNLKEVLIKLKTELDCGFYNDEQKEKLKNAYNSIKELYREILVLFYKKSNINIIKNCIAQECENYTNEINKNQTSLDNSISDYISKKNNFVNLIIDCIKLHRKEEIDLKKPKTVTNIVDKMSNGYIFRRIAKYHNLQVLDDFLSQMFVSKYKTLEKIEEITSKTEFTQAITGCTKINEIDNKWNENLKKFLDKYKEADQYILEASSKKREGGTLGEISLTYYKYHLNGQREMDVLFIDQPEDNLSNNHISKELITYLNNLRRTKQIIFVTHNPLLLINLDVDNVLKVDLINNELKCKYGCLEDEKSEILDYIANNMDGGKASIERRFKLYE